MSEGKTTTKPEALIDVGELSRRLSVSTRQIRRLVAEQRIPPSITLTRRAVRWRESDIESFIRGGCNIERWRSERGIATPRIAEAS